MTCFLCLITVFQLSAQQITPLPIDPQIRYGKLDNGLTYYIRHNQQPKERADFYIAQNVGSILEEENQRGLAHFLEHMAFGGTKHFPGKSLDEYTESLGMRMGENLNAYTSFDETVYMLKNVPVNRKSIVDSCLLILHDWSNFITLADTAIEKERGIIHEEWRTGQDAQARLWEQQLPKMYPNSRYANRIPIGTIDVIDNFKPKELRDYYQKWYRPDLQAIIIVGDIDVDQVETSIKNMFADIPAPVNPAKRERFLIEDNDEPLVSIAKDKEASNTLLYIFYKFDKLPDDVYASVAGVVSDYMQSICGTIINERFDEILQQANPPFIYAASSADDYMVSHTKGAWMTAALANEEEIDSALITLVREMQRVKLYGFTLSEYERARTNLLRQYESAYTERENQKNNTFTCEYVNHFTRGGYIPGMEMEYTLMNQIAPNISLEQINQYIQSIISDKNIVISLTGPDKANIKYPTEKQLLSDFRKAQQMPVEPYVENISNEPLIQELPHPGKIIETKEDPTFGALVLTLSNGIKVILKQTNFKKDEIIMTGSSPGGYSLYGKEEDKNLKLFNEIMGLGGAGNFSTIELGKMLVGKRVSCATAIAPDNESVNGSAAPDDLKTLFELIYLYMTTPRMDMDAYHSFESRLKAQLQSLELNPMAAFSDSLNQAVYSGNPRATRIHPEDFDEISYSRIIEIYKERFADASDFIFTFVGNIELDSIYPLIEQYLATLPSKNRIEKGNPANSPGMRTGIFANHFNRSMEVPKASVVNFYSGQTKYDLENVISATMLKQTLDLVYTEKIREEEGASYGVEVSAYISPFPSGETYLQIYFDTDPAKQEQMNHIIHEELQSLLEKGPRPEHFKKTQDNMLKRFTERLQENSCWLNILDNYYFRGIDSYTDYEKSLKSLTPEKIQVFAKRLLDQGNHIELIMNSTSKE